MPIPMELAPTPDAVSLGASHRRLPADQRQGSRWPPSWPLALGRRGFDRGLPPLAHAGRAVLIGCNCIGAPPAPPGRRGRYCRAGRSCGGWRGARAGHLQHGAPALRRWHGVFQQRGLRISSLQVQFSLLATEPLAPGGVLEVCRELGIELIAYSPLALGLLSGRWSLMVRCRAGRGALVSALTAGTEALASVDG